MSTEEARMDPVGDSIPESNTYTTNPTYTTNTTTGDSTTGNTGTSYDSTTGDTGASSSAGSTTGSARPADVVLEDELREFGKQIEAMFHTARTSTRGQEIESQLTAAWRDVEKGVNSAINQAKSSDFKSTVQGTARYAADEAQTGLARGLKNLNQWLAQKRMETEEQRQAREAAAAARPVENDIADRFSGSEEPVFGDRDNAPPPAPVEIKPDPAALTEDNPIADRFAKE